MDAAGKVDWSLIKNTPAILANSVLFPLPTGSDALLGDLTFNWDSINDVASVQAYSGTNTISQSDGYLVLATRGSNDAGLIPRLKITTTALTTYCSVVPATDNAYDVG